MAKLTANVKMVVFSAVVLLIFVAWHAIWEDPLVADTSEHEPTEHERETIEKIRQVALHIVEKASKPDGLYKRDAHPAPHGCVKARFTVNDDIEARFRAG